MREWSTSFQSAYLRLDRRVLGLFRIALGAVLLYDVVRRFPDAGLLWSSDGLLTSASLRKVPQATPQLSFLFNLEGAASVKLAFVGLGGVFLLYGLGLFTRVVQPLALLGYASLNARNIFFEDGGTGTVILLLTWTLFLPLGERYALDAIRRDARLPNLKARVVARKQTARAVTSLAGLGLLLQAAVIYWFNAVHKSGGTWHTGDAVHLVLWQHRVNTPLALWFAAHEPSWFSPLASSLTKRTEFIMPVLLLWPTHRALTRSLAFVFAVLLHGGIALCLTLGPFSYAMMCLLWVSVPGEALDAFALRAGRPLLPLGRRLARLRARAVRALRHARTGPAWFPPMSSTLRRRLFVASEVALAYVLCVEGASVLASNPAVPKVLQVKPPLWLRGYKPYLRARQGWAMFAPDAPREDGTMVVDATTASGRHLDPFTGGAPDWQQIRVGLTPHSIALSDYFFAMRDERNARYRRDMARYVKGLPVASRQERLRSLDVWWVSYVPPRRGQYSPGPIERKLLWHAKL